MGSIFLSWIFVATPFLGDIHQYQYLRSIRDARFYDKQMIIVLGYNIGQLVSGSHGQGSSQFRLWMFPRSWERGRGSIQQTCCGVSSELLSCSEGGVTRPHHKARAAQEISGVIHPSPHRAVLKWGNVTLSHTPVTCAYMQSAYEDIQFSVFLIWFQSKIKI